MAQDTGGAKDAGPWIDPLQYLEAKPDLPKETIETARKIGPLTYTVLIDEKHLVSKLYNMVNVPTGVWINEKGRIGARTKSPSSTTASKTSAGSIPLRISTR